MLQMSCFRLVKVSSLGGTDYDEYYVNDIKDTIDIITMALETTDFETQMIYYVSSW